MWNTRSLLAVLFTLFYTKSKSIAVKLFKHFRDSRARLNTVYGNLR